MVQVRHLVQMSSALVVLGCVPLKSFFLSESRPAPATPAPAPQPKPLVSNAFAYARYVALHLEETTDKELPVDRVEQILLDNAVRSKWSPGELLAHLSQPASKTSSALPAPASISSGPTKSTSQLRFEEFDAQVGQCSALGASREECCRALAWPTAVLPQFSSLEPAQANALLEAARRGGEKRAVLKQWFQPSDSNGSDRTPGFRLSGLKAWLGACHSVLTAAPPTLEEFNKKWASKLSDASEWSRMLHARSRAKRVPRRIFTRADGALSVAQTLDPDCRVKETEVILRRADGTLAYWVYDADGKLTPLSHFPASDSGPGTSTVEKLSPDSCMGCHYQFETRHFDQMKVSGDLLRLPKTLDLPVICQAPGEALAEDN